MRIKKRSEDIVYSNTIGFFSRRANKYREDNPYSVTMYQDSNPELVYARNTKEISKLMPLLKLDENSRVLDLACGIGRWSDAIIRDIDRYVGIDFCSDFIRLAIERRKRENRFFYVGSSTELNKVLEDNNEGKFNRALLIGSLMYLNDDDVIVTLKQLETRCTDNAIICIREPVGLDERLTLKEQYSSELSDNYNAIYRTRDELIDCFDKTLFPEKFEIKEEGFLFEDKDLNNRKETAQYYFILER